MHNYSDGINKVREISYKHHEYSYRDF